MKVIDLGTKKGGAIEYFLGQKKHFQENIKPGECLGIDLQEKYRDEVKSKGFKFECQDIVSEELFECDYYLAFDLLEHIPSKEDALNVLRKMAAKARKGIWIRVPSFEQDKRGEKPLLDLGLRFSWTAWKGHMSHLLLSEYRKAIWEGCGVKKASITEEPAIIIESTLDEWVVPVGCHSETKKYDDSLGKKIDRRFDHPLIGSWDIVVRFDR